MESEKHSLDDVETNLLRKGGIEWMIVSSLHDYGRGWSFGVDLSL